MPATSLMAAAAMPPSVGSARPIETCALEISCTAGHSRSMPSVAQSATNLATAAGAAGQEETPCSSHHRANMGAARIRAWVSAANTGFIIADSPSGLAQRLMDTAHLLAQLHQFNVPPQAVRTRTDLASQFGIEAFHRVCAFLQAIERKFFDHLVHRHRLAVEFF